MNLKAWNAGKKAELALWREWLIGKGKTYETPRRLIDRFNFMIGDKLKVLIANLGAGPVSLIGDFRRKVEVKIVASDLLADQYAKMRRELQLKPVNPVEKQDITHLAYRNSAFDIVYCNNALDYSQDPYKAISEMIRVCKPEGYIYLRHIAHAGQRNHYKGMNLWNVDMTQKGDVIFWNNDPNPKTDTFLLSEIYPGFTTTLRVLPKGAIVTSFVQKKWTT